MSGPFVEQQQGEVDRLVAGIRAQVVGISVSGLNLQFRFVRSAIKIAQETNNDGD